MVYATVQDLKAYLGATQTTDDDLLEALLTRAQAAIELFTRRTFEAVAETRKFSYSSVVGRRLYLDADIVSVTKVVNGDSAATEIAPGNYWLYPLNTVPAWAIDLASGYAWQCDDGYWIEITGSWGYATTAPADIVHACLRLAGYYYRQRDAQVFDTIAQPDIGVITVPQGIPPDVLQILRPYMRQGVV